MTNYFYSHLVNLESLFESLDEMNLTDDQKVHLTGLIDTTIHHTVLDIILSQLSQEDKAVFLTMMHNHPEDKEKIMTFLNSKVDSIEKQIHKTVQDLKTELHEDIKESHRLHGKPVKKEK